MSNDSDKKNPNLKSLNPQELTQSLKTEARRLGFELAGACPAVTPNGFNSFLEWIDAGYAGEMHYLEQRRDAYRHPESVLDEVKSLLMLGMVYKTKSPARTWDQLQPNSIPYRTAKDKSNERCDTSTEPGFGRIASYAWGTEDYHDLIHRRLKKLKRFVEQQPGDVRCRGVIDTAPLLEREFARLSGIGWQAKNTMLINREQGSYFFLAALLLDVELEYDQPFSANHCGTCTACLEACPTDAFPEPGVLDATRCISYLTIEHRSAIPLNLRDSMEDWILGCDVCQEVCPWNRKSGVSSETAFEARAELNPINLRELFDLNDEQFRKRFRRTPLWRPKRRGILRNAAIAMGNKPADRNLPALTIGLNDREPLVRGASAWSLGRHREELSFPILQQRQESEDDPEVLEEIQLALNL